MRRPALEVSAAAPSWIAAAPVIGKEPEAVIVALPNAAFSTPTKDTDPVAATLAAPSAWANAAEMETCPAPAAVIAPKAADRSPVMGSGPSSPAPVSYAHLDVYKRQDLLAARVLSRGMVSPLACEDAGVLDCALLTRRVGRMTFWLGSATYRPCCQWGCLQA